MKQIYDMVIVGGGPGGYTAALYAARAGLKTVVLEKLSAGGQMALTSQIDNYPGYPQGIDGFELGMQMQEGAERFGAETELAEVYEMDLRSDPKVIRTSEGDFLGKTVVIATGASPRYLGVPGEQELVGRGVNYCAHCDGMFYKGKTVAVVGGGNSAVQDALLLSRIAEKVILIHRREELRATKSYHAPLAQAQNIEFLGSRVVTELVWEEKLQALKLRHVHSGEESQIKVDGLFVSVGRVPATELLRGQVALDEGGYVMADESTRTNIPGVFAVGDVRTKQLRQVITAAADGAVAAHFAEAYLAEISA